VSYPYLGDALAFATIAHQGQTYGDRPYIEHPIAVARILLDATGDPQLAAAGLLHDTVEDTFVTVPMLSRAGFPTRIVAAVAGVTRGPRELYADFVRRAAADEDSRRVKLADNEHNLSGLPHRDRRHRRYVLARWVLIEANGGVDLHGNGDPVLAFHDPEGHLRTWVRE